MTKLLVLDIEGTIITSYDYGAEPDEEGRFQAEISLELRDVLKTFKESGWYIVTATGTFGSNIDYYQREFKRASIDCLIDAYVPDDHLDSDDKVDKLNHYCRQFQVTKEDVYYFDDGETNIERARLAGYQNSFQVTQEEALTLRLEKLIQSTNASRMVFR